MYGSTIQCRPGPDLFGHYIFRLRPFLALRHFHCDLLTFFEGFKPFHLDGAVMYEHIRATFLFNKSETFIVVKPLDGPRHSFACHINLEKNTRQKCRRENKGPSYAENLLEARTKTLRQDQMCPVWTIRNRYSPVLQGCMDRPGVAFAPAYTESEITPRRI